MKIYLIIYFLTILYSAFAVFTLNSFKHNEFLQRNSSLNESVKPTNSNYDNEIPIVINTWPFIEAGMKAWEVLSESGSALDAVEQGCSLCEELQCDGTVGYGGSPDENGETTLDAMIMDGETHDVGAVGSLRRIKSAISVARHVMEHTQHTLLVGSQATEFAIMMGFQEDNLTTSHSETLYSDWEEADCQPNFWENVVPDPTTSCGPYDPLPIVNEIKKTHRINPFGNHNHDTIGMVAIDSMGKIACGTSTNGAIHKIPGRVGDSPIPGSGAYVDRMIGGAAATGDGDVMMRFMPSLIAVEGMRAGMSPDDAAAFALQRITQYYSSFSGAVIALALSGEYGAACNNLPEGVFNFTVGNAVDGVHLQSVTCIDSVIFNEIISQRE